MAIKRQPRNLRGYGLAQAPKMNIDYGFVDDQNRRQAQDKSIEAQEAAQKRSFEQRDKKQKQSLLGKLHTVKGAWSPAVKNKINAEIEGFVKSAGDDATSMEDIILGLTKINSEVDVYNKIGEQASKNLGQVLAGKAYSSSTANKFANQELEQDFDAMGVDEALAAGMSILNSEFAPVPDPNQIQKTQESLINVAKRGEPTIEDFATLDYGKKVYKEKYGVPEEGRIAAAQNIYQGNQRYYDLFARDNGMTPEQVMGTIAEQMPTEVYGASTITDVQRNTDNGRQDNLKDYNPELNESVEATEFGEKKSYGVALPSGFKTTIGVGDDITEGTVERFKVDEGGKIKAIVTYRVPTNKTEEGAPTYALDTVEVDGEEEYKKLKSKYPSKTKALDKAYEVAKSAKEKASETVDFAEIAKEANEMNLYGTEGKGSEGSQKIIDKLKDKGVDIKDEDIDPTGSGDLKFTVNGKPFTYDFANEADIKKLQKDYESGFKVEKETSKKPTELDINSDIDPSKLSKGEEYIINGDVHVWDGEGFEIKK